MQWLIGLSSLRGVAITLIIIYHLFRTFLPGGFIAVDIFFALSGFLIASKLLAEYKEDKIHYWRFVRGQLKKIFPVLFICVILTLGIGYFVDQDMMTGSRENTFYALTFSTNIAEIARNGSYEANLIPNVFEHTWFLGLIIQFYLLFPLLLMLFLPIFRKFKTSIKWLGAFCIGLAGISAFLMYIYGVRLGRPDRAYFGLDTHATALMLGSALACVYTLKPKLLKIPNFFSWLLIIGPLTGVIVMSRLMSFGDPGVFTFGLSLTAILTIFMIAGIVQLQPSLKKPNFILRATEYIGNLSFGLYLFHWPLYLLLPFLLPENWPSWTAPTITIGISLGLSMFTNWLFGSNRLLNFLQKPPKFRKYMATTIFVIILLFLPVQTLINAPETSSIEEQLANEAAKEETEEQPTNTEILDYSGAATLIATSKNIILPFFTTAATLAPKPAAPSVPSNVVPIDASALIIGDSVILGARSVILATIRGSVVNAEGSRSITSAAGILASYKANGPLPKIIVIALGTNAYVYSENLLQGIVDVAGEGHAFIFVTAYAGQYPREQQNGVMRSFAATRSNVYIADWEAIAKNNMSFFWADRIHVAPPGRQALANLIAQTIGRIP